MRFVLVNSENAATVLGNPSLAATQVRIDAARHGFLVRDSWIDGHDLFGANENDLTAVIASDGYRGRVASGILRLLRTAIEASPTITERQKQRVLQAIDLELQPP